MKEAIRKGLAGDGTVRVKPHEIKLHGLSFSPGIDERHSGLISNLSLEEWQMLLGRKDLLSIQVVLGVLYQF